MAVLSLPYAAEDETIYSALASRILDGHLPYSGAVDNKPIGIFGFYWVIFWLFGKNNLNAIHLVMVAWISLTAYLLGHVYRSIFKSNSGIVVSLCYVVFSVIGIPPDVQGANTELISNLPLAASAYFLATDISFVNRHLGGRLILSGMLVGLAVLVRYPAGLAGCAWVIVLIHRYFSRQISMRSLCLGLIGLAIGFFLIMISNIVFLAVNGLWPAYREYAWSSHGKYLTSLKSHHIIKSFLIYIPIVALSWHPLTHFLWRQPKHLSKMGVYWFATMLLASCLGGRFFSHYFLAALPPLCLLAAPGITHLFENPTTTQRQRHLFYRSVLILFSISQVFSWNWFRLSFVRTEYQRYLQVSHFVRTITAPSDYIYVWGDAVQIYYLADRTCASRFVFSTFQTGVMPGTFPNLANLGSYVGSTVAWDHLMSDLGQSIPAVIIDAGPGSDLALQKALNIDAFPRLQSFVKARYRLAESIAGMDIYIRKDAR